ncbi:hypothetical protein COHA_000450 [Chlorella ohadii]|uniref:50S ribosomal protein L33 n=1 Tax=Chlorella ohadii TaxID=2649997 RepID=A0AAD5E168_9CHLO|nr:hypothetical protein COHA_000450 [Chlorella ohadii]
MQALRTSFFGQTFKTSVATQQQPSSNATRQVTCMAKKKGIRMIVTLECTEARGEGATPSRYTTQKNKKNTPERLEVMKYNKASYLKRHTLHKEIK